MVFPRSFPVVVLVAAGCAGVPAVEQSWPGDGEVPDLAALGRAPSAVEPDPRVSALVEPLPAPKTTSGRAGSASFGTGFGFALDPSMFLWVFEAEYYATANLALGPVLQLAASDDTTFLAPSMNAKGILDLPGGGRWDKLKPFLQGGLGFAIIDKDRSRDDDDAGFLFTFGFGADYYLNDEFSLGSSILFNILPDEVLDESFVFSWQLVTARLHF